MAKAYVALGANLGQALQALKEVVDRINNEDEIAVIKTSSFYKTVPIDSTGPDYINAVIEIQTELSDEQLLERLLEIEKDFGRVRPAGIHNAPRTMDLDLLLFEDEVKQSEFLTLPHPRMHERAFVLVPLCEISPEIVIPGKGLAKDYLKSVAEQGIERLL